MGQPSISMSQAQNLGKSFSSVAVEVPPMPPIDPQAAGLGLRGPPLPPPPELGGHGSFLPVGTTGSGPPYSAPQHLPSAQVAQLRAELRAELHRFGESFLTAELRKIAGRIEDNVMQEVRRVSCARPSQASIASTHQNGLGGAVQGRTASRTQRSETDVSRAGSTPIVEADFNRQETLRTARSTIETEVGTVIGDDDTWAQSEDNDLFPQSIPRAMGSAAQPAPVDLNERWDDTVAAPKARSRGAGRLSCLDRDYNGPNAVEESKDFKTMFLQVRGSRNGATRAPKKSFFDPTLSTLSSPSFDHILESSERAPKSSLVARLVESQEFDTLNAFFIVCNAATIGAQTNYLARNFTDKVPATYRVLEIIFACIFSAELALRAIHEQRRFFSGPQWRWNIFDSFVVGMQVAEELLTFVSFGNTSSFMRAVRLLRLARILRIVRILRLIGELRTIISSIVGSLRHVCWTLVLLALVIYAVAIYLTQMVSNHAVELQQTHGETLSGDELKFFGDLGSSVATLFESIAGGVDWYTYTRPLGKSVSPLVPIIVVSYIAFTLFAILNSVTGVFVESASKTAKNDNEQFVLGLAQNLLAKVDLDGNGHVTWEEFQACLEYQEMQLYFDCLELDIEDAAALFKLLDFDGSGTISYAEFLQGCFRLRGAAKAIEFASFLSAFNDYQAKLERRWMNLEGAVKSMVAMLQKLTKVATDSYREPSREYTRLPSLATQQEGTRAPPPQKSIKAATVLASSPNPPPPASRSPPLPFIEEGININPAKPVNIMNKFDKPSLPPSPVDDDEQMSAQRV